MCFTFTPARARELVAAGLGHVEGDGWDMRSYVAHLPAPRRPQWGTTEHAVSAPRPSRHAPTPETRQLAEAVLVRVLEERPAQLTQLVEEARQRTSAFIETRA